MMMIKANGGEGTLDNVVLEVSHRTSQRFGS